MPRPSGHLPEFCCLVHPGLEAYCGMGIHLEAVFRILLESSVADDDSQAAQDGVPVGTRLVGSWPHFGQDGAEESDQVISSEGHIEILS